MADAALNPIALHSPTAHLFTDNNGNSRRAASLFKVPLHLLTETTAEESPSPSIEVPFLINPIEGRALAQPMLVRQQLSTPN
jgi:hypothetical protein